MVKRGDSDDDIWGYSISVDEGGDELSEVVGVFDEILLSEKREDRLGVFWFFNKEHQEGKNSAFEGGNFLFSGVSFASFSDLGDGLVAFEYGDILNDLVFLYHFFKNYI